MVDQRPPVVFIHGLWIHSTSVSAEESTRLYERWTIPALGKPLFEAAVAEACLEWLEQQGLNPTSVGRPDRKE